MSDDIDLWHRPQPGPLYWDFRCMRCGQPVKDHPCFLARLWRRVGGWNIWGPGEQ
jgi:hypothetical protein